VCDLLISAIFIFLLLPASGNIQAPVMNKGFWAKFEAWLRYQLTHGQYEVRT
jgi:hypothetical protein